jgi:hypothetical protein
VLQRRYLDIANTFSPVGAFSYATRAAGYVACYGMPQVGEPDLRPSNHGQRWDAQEIEVYKQALLWRALCEHVPNTGERVEDFFVE